VRHLRQNGANAFSLEDEVDPPICDYHCPHPFGAAQDFLFLCLRWPAMKKEILQAPFFDGVA
jgi:hypothetical protein